MNIRRNRAVEVACDGHAGVGQSFSSLFDRPLARFLRRDDLPAQLEQNCNERQLADAVAQFLGGPVEEMRLSATRVGRMP
jgi:hypothetical protein